MNEIEARLVRWLIAAAGIILLTLIINLIVVEPIMMARKGLCWTVVQIPNNGPQHQYERCK